ncbi:hypothetical protein GGR54DRAFT_649850 [Hypoxylon sp. NC1633]|nr:hypothetical protein GGR54DRAFT_649850 [Hypoxylon sp. NC1633]
MDNSLHADYDRTSRISIHGVHQAVRLPEKLLYDPTTPSFKDVAVAGTPRQLYKVTAEDLKAVERRVNSTPVSACQKSLARPGSLGNATTRSSSHLCAPTASTFGGMPIVVLCGDFYQFEPVSGDSLLYPGRSTSLVEFERTGRKFNNVEKRRRIGHELWLTTAIILLQQMRTIVSVPKDQRDNAQTYRQSTNSSPQY